MSLSIQAWIVLITYILCVSVMIVFTSVKKLFGAEVAIATFLSLIYTALLTYDTHCLTVGDCSIWSWIRTVFYVILPIIGIIVMFSYLIFGSKVESVIRTASSAQPVMEARIVAPPATQEEKPAVEEKFYVI